MGRVRRNQIVMINRANSSYISLYIRNTTLRFIVFGDKTQVDKFNSDLSLSPRDPKPKHGGRFIIVWKNQPVFSSTPQWNAAYAERLKPMKQTLTQSLKVYILRGAEGFSDVQILNLRKSDQGTRQQSCKDSHAIFRWKCSLLPLTQPPMTHSQSES